MENNKIIGEILNKVIEIGSRFDGMEKDVGEIKKEVVLINKELGRHIERLDSIENKFDKLDKTEKSHFEYISNKFDRIEKNQKSNFEYLDDKIETSKNKMISSITEVFETFSNAASKTIENVENKIINEEAERKFEIDRLKNLDEYDKIVLRNLESRISILEEESEQYKHA